ncbi:DUF3592 domain-containing protein [Arthrobacter sp. B1805]|uniref:DUF3592 domain-containing protein n=1 Tax=Arthrobacter sp. B1805 TaxID=2058892 RepID=UPI000CE39CAF|nr:DUF3592 domain-containing protein [Arthrobacter sp. B1805]
MYLGWAVFVVVAAVSIIHAIRTTRRQERAVAAWPRTAATVTGHVKEWSSGAGGLTPKRRYYLSYQFVDAHGFFFAGQSEIPSAEVLVPGSTIEVAYNPTSPSRSFHQSSQTRQTLGCAIPFLVAIALAFYFFIGLFPE